jgi:hypothetical protein
MLRMYGDQTFRLIYDTEGHAPHKLTRRPPSSTWNQWYEGNRPPFSISLDTTRSLFPSTHNVLRHSLQISRVCIYVLKIGTNDIIADYMHMRRQPFGKYDANLSLCNY